MWGCQSRWDQGEDGSQIGAPGQPMGTCDHCGMGIKYVYSIRSGDGNVFKVGSQCVKKIYSEHNVKKDPIIVKINNDRRQAERHAQHEREKERIQEGEALVRQYEITLSTIPHTWREDETALDEFNWFMMNAGNKGKLKAIKIAKKRIGGLE